MNIKVYIFASLVIPFIALICIVIGLSIDSYTGHFNLSKEIEDGGITFLLLSYLLFILICLITAFIIVFFSPLLLKFLKIYNRKNFLISGAIVGAIAAIITLSLMADGNLTREGGLLSLWFGLAGMVIGFVNAYLYSKFAYTLDICD